MTTEATIITIDTAKGAFTGTIREACEWQAAQQGAWARVECEDATWYVDGVDFDAEDIDAAISAVIAVMHTAPKF